MPFVRFLLHSFWRLGVLLQLQKHVKITHQSRSNRATISFAVTETRKITKPRGNRYRVSECCHGPIQCAFVHPREPLQGGGLSRQNLVREQLRHSSIFFFLVCHTRSFPTGDHDDISIRSLLGLCQHPFKHPAVVKEYRAQLAFP